MFRQAVDILRELHPLTGNGRYVFPSARSPSGNRPISDNAMLVRLWREQDNHRETYELLASIHDWFSESFDTADLKVAELLFDALA